MNTYIVLVSGIAIGAMLLTQIKLITDFRQLLSAQILFVLMLGAESFVLRQAFSEPSLLNTIIHLIGSSVPPLFWLFTVSLFKSKDDPKGLSSTHIILFLTCMALSLSICFEHDQPQSSQMSELYYLDYLLKSVLVIMGLIEVAKNWRYDLVECRRKLRSGLMFMTGIFLLFSLMNEFIYDGQLQPDIVRSISLSAIAFNALFIGYWMLVSNPNALVEALEQVPEELSNNTLSTDTSNISRSDQIWLDKLSHCMQKETYYRNNNLTIRTLSQHISIPEHHLRRLINQHLGYRNFNDYLNRFRIKEASERLSDPEQARLPITTIAIESGYASLTTFNKAFKTLKEMTPSEFRRNEIEVEI